LTFADFTGLKLGFLFAGLKFTPTFALPRRKP